MFVIAFKRTPASFTSSEQHAGETALLQCRKETGSGGPSSDECRASDRRPLRQRFRLHAADLEILDRVTELREPILQVIGQQWSTHQVFGLLLVMNAAGFFENLAPILLAVIAAPEPGERQDLDTLRVGY